jgi:hypothetical protein
VRIGEFCGTAIAMVASYMQVATAVRFSPRATCWISAAAETRPMSNWPAAMACAAGGLPVPSAISASMPRARKKPPLPRHEGEGGRALCDEGQGEAQRLRLRDRGPREGGEGDGAQQGAAAKAEGHVPISRQVTAT